MAHPKARWEKGSPDTQARMAKVSQAAKAAREARVTPSSPAVRDSHAPFPVAQVRPVMSVDINEFTGINRGFPQTSFGPNFLPEPVKTQAWPGDKR